MPVTKGSEPQRINVSPASIRLDGLPEFPRNVLEMLRQPIEDNSVTIARSNQSLCFPAKFMLVAAMNPCESGESINMKPPLLVNVALTTSMSV